MRKLLVVFMSVFLVSVSSAACADNLVSIAVARFTSATSEATSQQASAVTDVFTDTLMRTEGIAVVGGSRVNELLRSQRTNTAGMIDPSSAAKAGRTLGCQYIILGSVTQLKETITQTRSKKATITNSKAEATLYINVISALTGETVYSDLSTAHAETSEASSNEEYIRAGLSRCKQQAVIGASRAVCSKIRAAIADISVRIVAVEGSSIILNQGVSQGVHIGDTYLVYTEGKEFRDLDGTFLGNDVVNIAILEIYEVQERYSRAEIVRRMQSGKVTLRAGDKARKISREEAGAMTRQRVVAHEEEEETPVSDVYYPPLEFERLSTNPERVIEGYDLSSSSKSARIASHRKLITAPRNRSTYESYVALANSYRGDYLAAYQAGMTALALGMREEALDWFRRSLEINPDYKPAQKGKAKAK